MASFKSLSFSHCPTELLSSLCVPLSFSEHHPLSPPGSWDPWCPAMHYKSHKLSGVTQLVHLSPGLFGPGVKQEMAGAASLCFTMSGASAGKIQGPGAIQGMGLGSLGGSPIHASGRRCKLWPPSVGGQPKHPHVAMPHAWAASQHGGLSLMRDSELSALSASVLEKKETARLFCHLALEVMEHHFCHIQLMADKSETFPGSRERDIYPKEDCVCF